MLLENVIINHNIMIFLCLLKSLSTHFTILNYALFTDNSNTVLKQNIILLQN